MATWQRRLLVIVVLLLAVSALGAVSARETPPSQNNHLPSNANGLLFNCYTSADVFTPLTYSVAHQNAITINCAPPGTVVIGIDVHVSLDHDCSTDLNIRLDNMVGPAVFLQERDCEPRSGAKELDFTTHAFDGYQTNHAWYLTLTDWCDGCDGYWNYWSIRVYYASPTATLTPTPAATATTRPTATLTRTRTPSPTPTRTSTTQPSATLTQGPSPAWRFEGYVLVAATPTAVPPPVPVTVVLFGSNIANEMGERLQTVSSNELGFFDLAYAPSGAQMATVYTYMNLVAAADGYDLLNAASESGGELQPGGWLRFAGDQPGRYQGNYFTLGSGPAPTLSRTPSSTPTSTPALILCPAEDTYVDEANPSNNYGDSPELIAGWGQGQGEDFARRILLRYDLAFMPPDVTIHSARLEMALTEADGLSSVQMDVYPLLDPFAEMHVTWADQPNTTGALAAREAIPVGYPAVVSWDVTSLVQAWVSGTTENHGLQLRGPESGSLWVRKFDSAAQQTAFCPRLVLNASGPAPLPTLTHTPTPTATPTATAICLHPDEAGDSVATAATIAPFVDQTGYICPSGDKDYWSFSANQWQEITVGLANPPGNPPGVPAPNYDLCLIRPDGSVADCSTNLNPSYGEYLSYTADATGTWRVVVQGKSATDWNKNQTYTLSVDICNELDEASDYFANATTMQPSVSEAMVNNPLDGYLCPPGDQDFYKFALPANMTITITVTLKNLPANFDLYLYTPSGSQVMGSANGGTADESFSYTITNQPGEWRVQVKPFLSTDYSATQPYRLEVDLAGLLRDFSADAWEVTQAIQNTANDVLLVADKTTYVRVYGRLLAGQTAGSVECVLHGTRGGSNLPGSPLKPVNGTQSLSSTLYDRAKAGDSWTFKLPASWISAGYTNLRAEVDPRRLYYENARTNNERSGTFQFQARAPVCEVFVPVRTHGGPTSTKDSNFWPMVDLMERLWPVPDVWVYNQNNDDVAELETCWWGIIPYPCYGPYELTGDGVFNDDSWKVLLALWNRDNFSDDPDRCDDAGARTHYIGMVHASTDTSGVNGSGLLATAHAWVKMPATNETPPTASATQPWTWPGPGSTLAHEMTHNYDVRHVDCGGPDDTEYYPYAPCQIDDTGPTKHYGFDVKSLLPIAPDAARDYMAYGSPRWVSDYRWERMFGNVGSGSAMVKPLQLEQGLPDLFDAGASVLVSGAVSTTTTGGTLGYAWVYPTFSQSAGVLVKWQNLASRQVDQARLREGEVYHLRLWDADQSLLDDREITLQQAIDSPGDKTAACFSTTFPAPSAPVARLELLQGETVLDVLSPGGSAPQVMLLTPEAGQTVTKTLSIAWQGRDGDDEDHLRYTLQYSPDLGQTWRVLAADMPAPPEGSIVTMTLNDLSGLPGSTAGALVRVAASDGYNTSLATSQPFEVPNQAPQVTILSPAPQQAYQAQDVVLLSGTATDVEDGGLSGESLRWLVEGQAMGIGQELLLSGMGPGDFYIELLASDEAQLMGLAGAMLHIETLQIPSGDAPALDGYADNAAWDQAVSLSLSPYAGGSQASGRLLRSGNDLYLSLTGLRSVPGDPSSVAGLLLDLDGSGGEQVQAGDLAMLVSEQGEAVIWASDGAGDWAAAVADGLTVVAVSGEGGWSATLRIDLAALTGLGAMPRLALAHLGPGEDASLWPYAAGGATPASWATTLMGAAVEHHLYLPLVRR